jgi:hypothetical protein
MAQGALGLLMLLVWMVGGTSQQVLAYSLWFAVNLAYAGDVGYMHIAGGAYRHWLALGGCVMGLRICFERMLAVKRPL